MQRNRYRCAAAVPALFIGLVSAQALAADPGRIDLSAARPQAVTVYNDQATVTRTGAVKVPAGDSVLVLSGIPVNVVRDSVVARGTADGKVAIGSVETRTVAADPEAVNRRRAEIEARLRENARLTAGLDARLSGFSAQQAFIDRLTGAVGGPGLSQPPGAASLGPAAALGKLAEDPTSWKAAWTAIREGTTEAGDGLRAAQAERETLERQRRDLEAQLAQVGGGRDALEIAVSVHAEAAATLELSVSYQVRGASWRPVYEARLDSGNGRLLVRQEAVVSQATGEDWRDVALTLSTARPSVGVRPPTLGTWRIDLVEPMASGMARRQRAEYEGAIGAPAAPMAMVPGQMLLDEARPAEMAKAAPVAVQQATAVVNGLAVEYAIPGAATVRADGTERRVRVGEFDTDALLTGRVVPKAEPRSYLHARFANASGLPLLPGAVALYLDGVFVGKGDMPLLRASEQAALPFGPDDRVKVVYEPQEQKKSQDGMLWGKKSVYGTEALITVKNFHKRPLEITVLDHAPVSSNADLAVAITTDPQPTARDVEDKPGVLAWTWSYQPGEERKIRFGYTATAPDGRQVTGLGR